MGAILATVSGNRQAIVDINRETGRNKSCSHLINYLILNPSMAALDELFCRGSRGWDMFCHTNQATEEANISIMIGMFVC
jgi:hypothetical protein